MSGLIKQLKNKLKTSNIFPVTLTKAVYDDDGNRLDNTLSDIDTKAETMYDNLKGIVCERVSGTLNTSISPASFTITGTKAGYTLIGLSPIWSNDSYNHYYTIEGLSYSNNGSTFLVRGFTNYTGYSVGIFAFWMKNTY